MLFPAKPTTAMALEEAKANKRLNSSISHRGKSQANGTAFSASLHRRKTDRHQLSSAMERNSTETVASDIESEHSQDNEGISGALTIEMARAHIADFLENTHRLELHMHNYPTFDARELLLGKWLGKGGFSDVEEIRNFLRIPRATRLAASATTSIRGQRQEGAELSYMSRSARDSPPPEELGYEQDLMGDSTAYCFGDPSASFRCPPGKDGETCRRFITKNCLRESGEARYAIKHLRKDIARDPNQCISGAMDLAIEALFLSGVYSMS